MRHRAPLGLQSSLRLPQIPPAAPRCHSRNPRAQKQCVPAAPRASTKAGRPCRAGCTLPALFNAQTTAACRHEVGVKTWQGRRLARVVAGLHAMLIAVERLDRHVDVQDPRPHYRTRSTRATRPRAKPNQGRLDAIFADHVLHAPWRRIDRVPGTAISCALACDRRK